MDEREAANRSIAEHVEELRRRLADGKDEIERQRAAVQETNEHLTGMRRWIEQTDEQLGNERARRDDASMSADD
jgi:predicted  nucleic acid-binding Zn-ribbon protein